MIQIMGDIDTVAFENFDNTLSRLEDSGKIDLTVHLMSDGGDATVGLAFFDRIRLSSLEITIIAFGEVGSAATLVFAAGDKRVMSPNSSLFFHEEQCGALEGAAVRDAQKTINNCRDVDQQYNRLLSSVTKKGIDYWDYLSVNEEYLSPEQALEAGICDEILKY